MLWSPAMRLTLPLLALSTAASYGGNPWLTTSLTTHRAEYLIGEPIVMLLDVSNTTGQVRDIRTPSSPYDRVAMGVRVSEDGKVFDPLEDGILYPLMVYPKKRLMPGQSHRLERRIFQSGTRPSGLAFDRAGTYFLRAVFTDVQSNIAYSNVIQIRVKEPEGRDAKVWKAIKDRACLNFLQFGHADRDSEATATKLADLLARYPDTGYAEAIRYALKLYYDPNKLQLPDRLKRKLLAVLKLPKEGFRPDDKRLDVKVTYGFPDGEHMTEVLRVVSQQSGVTLQMDPELAKRPEMTFGCAKQTVPLRKFMMSAIGWGLSTRSWDWVPVDDGFLFTRFERAREIEAQQLADHPPQNRADTVAAPGADDGAAAGASGPALFAALLLLVVPLLALLNARRRAATAK